MSRGPRLAIRGRPGCRHRSFGVALVALLLLAACAAPVSVRPLSPLRAQRELSRNVISDGSLSDKARILLRRLGMERRWRSDPAGVLEDLHGVVARPMTDFDAELIAEWMDAVAELSFAHASKTKDRRYYLAAVVYAWRYLLPRDPTFSPSPLDRGVRLAADLYNRGIALAFMDPETGEVVFEDGDHALPFGTIEVDFDESSVFIEGYEITDFVSMADLEVRGLNNRYRFPGLGAPLSGRIEPEPGDEEPTFARLRVPVTAVLELDEPDVSGEMLRRRGRLRVIPRAIQDWIEVGPHRVPLESEPSATLALQLAEEPPWRRELAGFFRGDLSLGPSGLLTLSPYQSNRIPLVLVHGTASSVGRWADLVNDLASDPVLRRHFQIWLFQYNTGNPVAYSGWLLRKGIRDLVARFDPGGEAAPLRDLVVLGHSQGGLLTKLLTVDSGDVFWRQVTDQSPEEVDLSPESRELLEGALFVEPSPYVRRVIFLSTPHHGSRLADLGLARLLARMVRSPANLVAAAGDLLENEPEDEVQRRLHRGDGALGNMSPRSPFIRTLAELPIASGVASHSIIGVRGEPKEESGDGVVSYRSAHLPGVDSELVIRSGHSSQANPEVVAEVRRILLEHLQEALDEGILTADR